MSPRPVAMLLAFASLSLCGASRSLAADTNIPLDEATTAREAQVRGAILLHRQESCDLLSQQRQAGGPALCYPSELDPQAFTGGLHSDLRKPATRQEYYQRVFRDILLMTDADLGDISAQLKKLQVITDVLEQETGVPGKVTDGLNFLNRPTVRNLYSRFLRFRAVPEWYRDFAGKMGKIADGLTLANDVVCMCQIYCINEESVRARAAVLKRLAAASPFKDPAVTPALAAAETEAVAMASNIQSALAQVLVERHANFAGAMDAARLLGFTLDHLRKVVPKGVKVPYLAPHGLRTALSGISSGIGKYMGAGCWVIWAGEIFWEDGVQVDQSIQRAVAADTILCYLLDRDLIDRVCTDGVSRVQAYACAGYCAYMSSAIMADFIDRRSMVGLLRNTFIRCTNPKFADLLDKRLRIRTTAKDEMLGHAGALESWLATAHRPFAGLRVTTDLPGAEVSIDGQLRNGLLTPASVVVDLDSFAPEDHAVTVSIAGRQPVTQVVSLTDGQAKELWIPFQDGAGMLDVVFCIDHSGSMLDDIRAVQESADAILDSLTEYASQQNISVRVGLVTFTRHDEPDWIHADPLTGEVKRIRSYIHAVSIANPAVGKGGNEDLYGAMLYAMNEPVGGRQIDMGWRPGAAKILIPMGDEPPDDPDWENHTLDDVDRVARNLDPVHIYPLLTPKQGGFLDPAARAMDRIAQTTGGTVVRAKSAEEVPDAILSAIKLAVRQHRNEVWRKQNPPYVLYGAIGAVLVVIVVTTLGIGIRAAIKPLPARKVRAAPPASQDGPAAAPP